ncbi:MAG: AAA family ATPase [Oscillospiraceae bacterium]|nr:AAA family ATPase [Oscillospiraceae bacterium]
MGKVIAVASGKGGTGKTTSVAAISSCLAALGHKTLCIDFDAGLGNLDLALGMTDYAVMDYLDVIRGHIGLSDACRQSPLIENLYFLSAPVNDIPPDEDLSEAVLNMLNTARELFDYCIIDSPPGIGAGFALANRNADMSIIVTLGELPAMSDATRAARALREMGVLNIRLLVNRVVPSNFGHIRTTIDDVIDSIGVQLIGIAAEDKCVFRALHSGIPLVLYKKRVSAYDFLDIAHRITGKDIPLHKS